MNRLLVIVLSVICLYTSCICGSPRPNRNPTGVGAYAYQDSTGNRYGGTFDLNDGDFGRNGGFPDGFPGNFFPEYFRNLQSLLQETFNNIHHQTLALNAAKKAYDLTSNQANFAPNFAPFADRQTTDFSGFGELPNFGNMENFGFGNVPGYSAFAGGVVSPNYEHQIAGINPQNTVTNPFTAAINPAAGFTDFIHHQHDPFNWIRFTSPHNVFAPQFHVPNMPNVNVKNRFAESSGGNNGQPHFVSVSSSSYSNSDNVNGKETNRRGAETVINRDGKITSYKVNN